MQGDLGNKWCDSGQCVVVVSRRAEASGLLEQSLADAHTPPPTPALVICRCRSIGKMAYKLDD